MKRQRSFRNSKEKSQESCPQGLETNHSVVPGKALRIDAKAYGGSS